MKLHPITGENICRPLHSLRLVLPIIRHHHEHSDGSGYPDGLRGSEIPVLPRVLQVVDVYDALRTARSYKPPLTHEQAAADHARRSRAAASGTPNWSPNTSPCSSRNAKSRKAVLSSQFSVLGSQIRISDASGIA